MPPSAMSPSATPPSKMLPSTVPPPTMPLSAFRVLQIGSGIALDYCGRLFADFGADVIKAEPSGGDPLRAAPPRTPKGESALFAWLKVSARRSEAETASAAIRSGSRS